MKVLLVDDHALIREARCGVMKELQPDAPVLDAADCGQAMRLLDEHADVNLILLDLNLPDRDGFDVLADLRERYPVVGCRRRGGELRIEVWDSGIGIPENQLKQIFAEFYRGRRSALSTARPISSFRTITCTRRKAASRRLRACGLHSAPTSRRS